MKKSPLHEEYHALSVRFPKMTYAVIERGGWTTRYQAGEVIFEGWEILP